MTWKKSKQLNTQVTPRYQHQVIIDLNDWSTAGGSQFRQVEHVYIMVLQTRTVDVSVALP